MGLNIPSAIVVPPLQAEAAPATENTHCVVCGRLDGVIPSMILCDGDTCHAAFHLTCLNPPLQAVPPGGWFCPCCKVMQGGAVEHQPALSASGMVLDNSCPPPQTATSPGSEPAPPPCIPPPPPWRPPNVRGQPPPQAAEPLVLPQTRPAPTTRHPYHYCSHCWVFGSHWTTECPDIDKDPLTRPDNFTEQLKAAHYTWNSQARVDRFHSTRRRNISRNSTNNPNNPPDFEP